MIPWMTDPVTWLTLLCGAVKGMRTCCTSQQLSSPPPPLDPCWTQPGPQHTTSDPCWTQLLYTVTCQKGRSQNGHKSTNKNNHSSPSNSMIGRLTAVLGTAFLALYHHTQHHSVSTSHVTHTPHLHRFTVTRMYQFTNIYFTAYNLLAVQKILKSF